jgi:hypothetical protein
VGHEGLQRQLGLWPPRRGAPSRPPTGGGDGIGSSSSASGAARGEVDVPSHCGRPGGGLSRLWPGPPRAPPRPARGRKTRFSRRAHQAGDEVAASVAASPSTASASPKAGGGSALRERPFERRRASSPSTPSRRAVSSAWRAWSFCASAQLLDLLAQLACRRRATGKTSRGHSPGPSGRRGRSARKAPARPAGSGREPRVDGPRRRRRRSVTRRVVHRAAGVDHHARDAAGQTSFSASRTLPEPGRAPARARGRAGLAKCDGAVLRFFRGKQTSRAG